MSNCAYLSISNINKIYPGYKIIDYNPDDSWALMCGGCVPVLWLAMFGENNITKSEFVTPLGKILGIAPLDVKNVAITRLSSRRNFISDLFRINGGLDDHINMFIEYIVKFKGEYITIQCDEISALYKDDEFYNKMERCLIGLDNLSNSVYNDLVDVSTVLTSRKFISPIEIMNGKYPNEDWCNIARIMGDSYIIDSPWS